MRRVLFGFCLSISLFISSAYAVQSQVAVVVYGQNASAKQYLRVAQTRFEQLLADNGVVVLDQKKAEQLKKSWVRLSDPSALITAEDFVENAGRYDIAGIYRIYIGVGKTEGLSSTFTATSTADIRYIGEDAQIRSFASAPMGTKGAPPSDGLTESAAVNNAIQRAIDSTAEKFGLQVMDITSPRLVRFSLKSVSVLPDSAVQVTASPRLSNTGEMVSFAKLQSDDWTSEEATCVRASPDGRMAAVGTYLMRTAFNMGRPTRSYASYLHVVDADAKSEVERFEVSIKDPRYQRGGSKITDCMFLQTWRYVAAVSQSHLIFADTERGVELGRVYFDEPFNAPVLIHLRDKEVDYLAVGEGARRQMFQVVRE
ncbi:MAG: hypothetical protein WCT35_00485 [Sideroxydans sp.]|jgi:hypothetical protein